MLEIVVYSQEGKLLVRHELVESRPLKIGRGTVCDIQVPIQEVSRQHARLEKSGDEWILRDLESTHGCVLDGERMPEIRIRAGMKVRLGSAVVKFKNLAHRIGKELDASIREDELPHDSRIDTQFRLADTLPSHRSDDPDDSGLALGNGSKKRSGIFKLIGK